MKKDTIDTLFDRINGTFDVEEPIKGHQERFLEKLNPATNTVKTRTKKKTNFFRYWSIAASLLLFFSLGSVLLNSSPSINEQVVEISPEISKTEFYFANLIAQEIKKLQNESSPETQKIIADTMVQLARLERSYKSLENDLINGGNSKFILSAMIINFKTRTDLLDDVLHQIEAIKKIKKTENENTII